MGITKRENTLPMKREMMIDGEERESFFRWHFHSERQAFIAFWGVCTKRRDKAALYLFKTGAIATCGKAAACKRQ